MVRARSLSSARKDREKSLSRVTAAIVYFETEPKSIALSPPPLATTDAAVEEDNASESESKYE